MRESNLTIIDSPAIEDLIEAARHGSADALGQILDGWRNYLLNVANHALESGLLPKAGASDLVQETFLKASRGFGQFHGRTNEELVAWLSSILHHNVQNFNRAYCQTGKRRVAREIPLESCDSSGASFREPLATGDQSPSSRMIADEEWHRLNRGMERLPDNYRRVIVLRHQEGRSYAEIGRLLDRTEEAARKLWVRAVERLAEEMSLNV